MSFAACGGRLTDVRGAWTPLRKGVNNSHLTTSSVACLACEGDGSGWLRRAVPVIRRIQVKTPEPIPEAEARWDWEWMASWGLLRGTFDAATQTDAAVQRAAHAGC